GRSARQQLHADVRFGRSSHHRQRNGLLRSRPRRLRRRRVRCADERGRDLPEDPRPVRRNRRADRRANDRRPDLAVVGDTLQRPAMTRLGLALTLAVVLTAAVTAYAAGPKASLKVTYWAEGLSGPKTTWTLRCGPAAGTHPAPRLACKTLSTHVAELGPAARACTLMPKVTSPRARIKGTWAGRSVDRTHRIGGAGWAEPRHGVDRQE